MSLIIWIILHSTPQVRIRRESRQVDQAERSELQKQEVERHPQEAFVYEYDGLSHLCVYICVVMCCFVALYFSFVESQFTFLCVVSVWLWNRTMFV